VQDARQYVLDVASTASPLARLLSTCCPRIPARWCYARLLTVRTMA